MTFSRNRKQFDLDEACIIGKASETLSGLFNRQSRYVYHSAYVIFPFDL